MPFTKWWIPYFILIFGLVITFGSTMYVARTTETQDGTRFSNSVQHIHDSVNDRLSTYTALLRASAGLFDASEVVTNDEFKDFADRLHIREVYPGIQGIGYLPKLTSEEMNGVVIAMRREGYVDFAIKPDYARDEYFPILYIEPMDRRNRIALGYDMYTEKTRRLAMDQAQDTGSPAISSKVSLIQEIDPDKQAGFLVYVPFYSTGNIPQTIQKRRESLEGFVYSPFRADDFFNGILGGRYNSELDFKVYDTEVSEEMLLHDSSIGKRKIDSYTPTFTEARNLSFAGHNWIFVFQTRPSFDRQSEKDFVPFIFAGGIVMTVILFALSQLQYAARRNAELYSEEMQRSEVALQKSNNRVNDILESITDGFIAISKRWRFTYVNHEAARTLGKSASELLGKNIWQEFPDLEKSSFGKLYKKTLRRNKPMSIEDFYAPFDAWFLVRVYPSRTGLSIYFQNITDRKEQERRKDEFISIASHELKTPVTTIKAFTQLLHRKFNNNRTAEKYLLRMNEQIDKLTLLINDLLDVSKIQAGKVELRMNNFNLAELLQSTIEALRETAVDRNIKFEKETDIIVYGDEDRIGQVIVNFLTNAMKYSDNNKPIKVSLRLEKRKAIVAVSDFGRGIEKQYQNRIFDRFFRVSPSAERSNPGLGMGLYISAQIIKRHNGTIWVESKKNEGSTFYFSLPI